MFDGYDIERMAHYSDDDLAQRLTDTRIVRNRLKVASARRNARAYLRLRDDVGGLGPYLWGQVDGRPVVNGWTMQQQVPARTPLSDRISKDLQKRDFTFVGSTIIYAYLQAIGVVNDHLVICPQHAACQA